MPDRVVNRMHEHAHGTIPHVAATGGVISLSLWALLMACALWSASHAPPHNPRGQKTGLERSLVFALLALLIVGQFEPLHVGSRLKQFFWVVIALTPAWIPRQRVLAEKETDVES